MMNHLINKKSFSCGVMDNAVFSEKYDTIEGYNPDADDLRMQWFTSKRQSTYPITLSLVIYSWKSLMSLKMEEQAFSASQFQELKTKSL